MYIINMLRRNKTKKKIKEGVAAAGVANKDKPLQDCSKNANNQVVSNPGKIAMTSNSNAGDKRKYRIKPSQIQSKA